MDEQKTSQVFDIKVHESHLSKISSVKPTKAIEELIWNGLDADANKVEVFMIDGEISIDRILIRDDGLGIPHHSARDVFETIGGSWKAEKKTTPSGRQLHGKNNQGRFTAYSLGGYVEWKTVYKNDADQHFLYTLIGKAGQKSLAVTEEVEFDGKAGTEVVISNVTCTSRLSLDKLRESLTSVFAIYLTLYPTVSILIDGQKIQVDELVADRVKRPLPDVVMDGQTHTYELEIYRWNKPQRNAVYLCNESGFALEKYSTKIQGSKGFYYTAYVKSKHLSQLHDKGGLGSIDMLPELQDMLSEVKKSVKDYLVQVKIEQEADKFQRWRSEGVYPFSAEPKSQVERAERQLFDIMAISISEELPGFDLMQDIKLKRMQFKMLKQLLEQSGSHLNTILSEVFELSKKRQEELALLLEKTSLSHIITTANTVRERLSFLTGMKEIIFDTDYSKHMKERSQLHRILADNTWIFGDSFALSVDDQSLTKVLEKHLQATRQDEIIVDKPVRRLDDKNGIVDLMLTRSIPSSRPNQKEHLIVELKAPKQKIGEKELSQIKSYAYAVSEDPRFNGVEVTWECIIIGKDYDRHVAKEMRSNEGRSDGFIQETRSDDGLSPIRIYVKTWAQIFQECEHRLRFLQEELNLSIDLSDGLNFLKDRYAKYTEGVLDDVEGAA